MKARVIVQIDDDEDDCELFCEVLKSVSDAQYHAFYDAAEALRCLGNGQVIPDIIFLDLNMPRMNGREFLSAMRSKENLTHIPVIIFSTSDRNDMLRETIGLTVSGYVTKPNDLKVLQDTIRQQIDALEQAV